MASRCRGLYEIAAAVGGPPRLPPDLYPLVGSDVEFLPWLDVERGVPGVEVAHGKRPELVGRVAVGQHDLAQDLGPHLACPRLRVSEEEALVAGEAVDDRSGLAAKR